MDAAKRESEYKLWKKAVTRTFDWVDEAVNTESHRSRNEAGNHRKEIEVMHGPLFGEFMGTMVLILLGRRRRSQRPPQEVER